MSVKQRITSYIEYKEIKQIAFTNSIGVSKGYVGAISRSIGTNILNRISKHYPDLNIEWLLTGSGEMIKTESNVVNEKKTEYEKPCSNCKKLAGQIEELRNIISQQNKTIADLNREIGKLSSNNESSN